MFTLEPLAFLRGIEEVEIQDVSDYLKQCLELRIRGQGGELVNVEWPTKVVHHKRKAKAKPRTVETSTQ